MGAGEEPPQQRKAFGSVSSRNTESEQTHPDAASLSVRRGVDVESIQIQKESNKIPNLAHPSLQAPSEQSAPPNTPAAAAAQSQKAVESRKNAWELASAFNQHHQGRLANRRLLDDVPESDILKFLAPLQVGRHPLGTFRDFDPYFDMQPADVDLKTLGKFVLKYDDHLPVHHFKMEDKLKKVGSKFLPVYEFTMPGAYLVFGEGDLPNRLYKLPAGHYRPHRNPLAKGGMKVLGRLAVNILGDKWRVFEVKVGYFFHGGEVCVLPSGALITPEEPRPMMAVREFLSFYSEPKDKLSWRTCLDSAIDKHAPNLEVRSSI